MIATMVIIAHGCHRLLVHECAGQKNLSNSPEHVNLAGYRAVPLACGALVTTLFAFLLKSMSRLARLSTLFLFTGGALEYAFATESK